MCSVTGYVRRWHAVKRHTKFHKVWTVILPFLCCGGSLAKPFLKGKLPPFLLEYPSDLLLTFLSRLERGRSRWRSLADPQVTLKFQETAHWSGMVCSPQQCRVLTAECWDRVSGMSPSNREWGPLSKHRHSVWQTIYFSTWRWSLPAQVNLKTTEDLCGVKLPCKPPD